MRAALTGIHIDAYVRFLAHGIGEPEMSRGRRRFATSTVVVAVLVALSLAPASSADLPIGYDVQKVGSPAPATNGNFGLGFTAAGDVDDDGTSDLVVGTDEHGGSTGPVFVISGDDGSLIRQIPTPDPAGDTGTSPSFGSYVGSLPDVGSCPGGTPGATCPSFGSTDGTP